MANVLGRHSLRQEKNGSGEVVYFLLEFETRLALRKNSTMINEG